MEKKIAILLICGMNQAFAKEPALREDMQKKEVREHAFYKQARNLGKKSRENLYDEVKIRNLNVASHTAPLAILSSKPSEGEKVSIKIEGEKEKVYNSINEKDTKGRTVLHWMCYLGDLDAVKAFVELDADLEAQDDLGWTPLHCAAVAGHADIVKYLVQKGADRRARTNNDATAYWIAAVDGGSNEVVRALEGSDDMRPLDPVKTALVVSR